MGENNEKNQDAPFNPREIDAFIAKYPKGQSGLISLLQDVEDRFGYLPKEILSYISQKTKIAFSEIYGVATFYEFFSLDPKGIHVLKLCDGTSCHAKRSTALIQSVKQILGLNPDEWMTKDGLISIEIVSCLGGCAISPAVMLDDIMYPHVTIETVTTMLENLMHEEVVPV